MNDNINEICELHEKMIDCYSKDEEFITLDDFINTSNIRAGTIFTFLFSNTEDTKDKGYNVCFCIGVIQNELNIDNSLFNQYFNKDEGDRDSFLKEFVSNKDYSKFYRDLVKIVIYKSFSLEKQKAQLSITLNNINDFYDFEHNPNYFYRGQEDYSWNLTPSFLRDYKYEASDGCIIDKDKLFQIYNDTELLSKFSENFACSSTIDSSSINYDFLAFMQHSIAYSPLIDLTSDRFVASLFAIKRSHPNTFLQRDSALFILDLYDVETVNENRAMNDLVNKYNVIFLNKKISPGTIMVVEGSDGKKTELDFTTIKKIKSYMTPEFAVFSVKQNDRMKYQKGSFLLFNKFLSVKGKIYYNLSKKLHLFKQRIKVSDKDKILKTINARKPHLKMSYLMSPYDVFLD